MNCGSYSSLSKSEAGATFSLTLDNGWLAKDEVVVGEKFSEILGGSLKVEWSFFKKKRGCVMCGDVSPLLSMWREFAFYV